MEGIGKGKGFVAKINLIIGSFSYKTQQITNPIQCGEAIYFPTPYNTTNTLNKLLCDIYMYTQLHRSLYRTNPIIKFIPVTTYPPVHIPSKFQH